MPTADPSPGKASVQNPIKRFSLYLLGSAGLSVALLASGILTLHSLGGPAAPGCGAGAGCEQAAATVWGSVPGLGLPTSALGFAYFTACLPWWSGVHRRGATTAGLWLVSLAALYSLLLLTVLITSRLWCPYCLAAHAGNLLFVLAVHWQHRATRPLMPPAPRAPLAGLLAPAICGLITISLLTWRWSALNTVAQAARAADLQHSTARILAAAPANPTGFRGRYLRGPESSKARVVVFTDFQCAECRRIEGELDALSRQHPSIQVSLKHFPLCSTCNRAAVTTIHEHACDAALAAEAAGRVGGPVAYWKAVQWIFDRGGEFTFDQFLSAAAPWGLDPGVLRTTISNPATLALVTTDVEDGLAVGVSRTPTIFINGIELKGWETPGALSSTIQTLLASPLSPATVENDHPPLASAKAIEDWRAGPRVLIPPRTLSKPVTPPANSPLRVILFGDYQDANSAQADAILRQYALTWPSTTYEFRHFPASSACNPRLKINPHPLACRMARTVEAARMLGGESAFLRMHEWLQLHRQDYSDAGVREFAPQLQIDASVLLAANKDTRVLAALQGDIDAGNALGITAIPAIYINERFVPVWKTDQGELLTQMLDLAAQESPTP